MSSNATTTSQLASDQLAISQLNAVYFVNSDLADLDTLLAGVPQGAQVVLLDPAQDGLTQMLAALQGRTGLDAIHIIGHGSSGLIDLGNTSVTTQTLTERAQDLAALGSVLTATGDILLYGCNVAEGANGLAFVDALATATGADVAASTDLTGAVAKGGDWELEAQTGAIESTTTTAPAYTGLLDISYNVNVAQGAGGSTATFSSATSPVALAGNTNDVKVEILSSNLPANSGIALLIEASHVVDSVGFNANGDDSSDTGDFMPIVGYWTIAAAQLQPGYQANPQNYPTTLTYWLGWTSLTTPGDYVVKATLDWGYSPGVSPGVDETITFNIHVTANQPPVTGTNYSYTIAPGGSMSASYLTNANTGSWDPDNDTLTYTLTGTTIIAPSNAVHPEWKNSVNVGTQNYSINDGKGHTENGGWIYVLANYTDDATIWVGSPADQTWSASGTNSYTLSGASDPDDTVYYSGVSGSPAWMTVASNGQVYGNVAPEFANRSYTLTVRATGSTSVDRTSFTINTGSDAALLNDLPTASLAAQSVAEEGIKTFAAGNFNFYDLDNAVGGSTASGAALASVRINTLPTNGTLKLSGTPVSATNVITTANIGSLTYTPNADYKAIFAQAPKK
ncbi:MAG: DUF4347 domain-containing protein [Rhodoferax sp.]|jgi:hypothetical protein|nr:DUF4347 domain-containing protein [Rhodoferax sp.]